MSIVSYWHTATLLADGRVLFVGSGGDGSMGLETLLDLYDPATNTWARAGSMASGRVFGHTATLLADGRVLVAAGQSRYADGGGRGWDTSAELYDPTTNTWSSAGSMATARGGHTATLLADGRVLVTGGGGSEEAPTSAEVYDPTVDTWSSAGALARGRSEHTATLLADGRVLVAGGTAGSLVRAELYDPTTNTWSSAGSMSTPRRQHVAALLLDGRVLVAGGSNLMPAGSTLLASAELYVPDGVCDDGGCTMLDGGVPMPDGGASIRDGGGMNADAGVASIDAGYGTDTPAAQSDAGDVTPPDAGLGVTDAAAILVDAEAATRDAEVASFVPRRPTSCFCTVAGARSRPSAWPWLASIGLLCVARLRGRKARAALALVVLALASGAPLFAAAQDAPGDSDALGRAEYDRGAVLYRDGRFRDAAVAFERAYQLSGRPAMLRNLYLARRDSGDVVGAVDALRRYLADDTTISAEERTLLRARLRAMDQTLEEQGRGRPGAPTTDGSAAPARTGGAPVVSATPADSEVATTPSPRASSEGASAVQSGASDLATLGGVTLGFAAVPILTGVVFGTLALDASAELDRACTLGPMANACPVQLDQDSIVGRFEAFRAATWVSVGLAVVTAGAGLAMLLSANSSSDQARALRALPSVAIGGDGTFLVSWTTSL